MNSKKEVQHVYLVGAKSLGAYGGYETFVYKLTEYHQNKENIKYHVACKANGDGCMDESKFEGVTKINDHEFEFHNAHCFKIDVPQIGSAQAIYYDVAALKACCEHIKKNHIPHPIVYIMACRIGPFAGHFYREIHKLGGTVFLNPDGYGDYKGQWEFPGGKIEPGETPQQALKREIEEELDTEIAVGNLVGTIEYDYPAFHLSMDCFWCEVVSGDLVLKEAEAARWLTKDDIDSVPWLPADQTILDVIRSSMQPVKPLHTSEYDKEPLQRC